MGSHPPSGGILEVVVPGEGAGQLAPELLVGALLDGVHGGAHIIQHGEDPWRPLALDQLAHSQVVEIL